MKQLLKTIIIILFLCTYIEVNAATTFSVAECSEPNYIRKSPGSNDKLKDVDNETILLQTNHKVEILEKKEYNGAIWYKIYTNYYSSNYTGYIYSGYFKNVKDEYFIPSIKNFSIDVLLISFLSLLTAIFNASISPIKYNFFLARVTAVYINF